MTPLASGETGGVRWTVRRVDTVRDVLCITMHAAIKCTESFYVSTDRVAAVLAALQAVQKGERVTKSGREIVGYVVSGNVPPSLQTGSEPPAKYISSPRSSWLTTKGEAHVFTDRAEAVEQRDRWIANQTPHTEIRILRRTRVRR